MRSKLSAIVLFIVCLGSAGRTIATPGPNTGPAASALQPAQYLSLIMNRTPAIGNAPLPTFGLSGSVYVNPRWVIMHPQVQPVMYEILLDVTGSMSYDFAGHGTVNGTDYRCEIKQPADALPYTDTCNGGANAAWRQITERRVYVTKQAIQQFIDQMHSLDVMQIVAFSSDLPAMAAETSGWSSDKPVLKQALMTLGAYQNDPYRTTGSASTPSGMDKAQTLLASAPTTAPNGQPYKHVIILITDSVANVFRDGTLNTAREICSALSVQQALETADPCQTGTTAGGKLRPLSALIEIANSLKAGHLSPEIYVIGLANVDETGLARVANDLSYFYPATQPAHVSAILAHIVSSAITATCTATGGYQWIDRIDAAHVPDPSPLPIVNESVVGYTYVYDSDGRALHTLPIQRDLITGTLSWQLAPPDPSHPDAGIAPGTYRMQAFIRYKGNDEITRQYDHFSSLSALEATSSITFTIAPSGGAGPILPFDPLYLDLSPNVRLCP